MQQSTPPDGSAGTGSDTGMPGSRIGRGTPVNTVSISALTGARPRSAVGLHRKGRNMAMVDAPATQRVNREFIRGSMNAYATSTIRSAGRPCSGNRSGSVRSVKAGNVS